METVSQMLTNVTLGQHDQAKRVFNEAMGAVVGHPRAIAAVYRAGYLAGQEEASRPAQQMPKEWIPLITRGIVGELEDIHAQGVQEATRLLLEGDPDMTEDMARFIAEDISREAMAHVAGEVSDHE